MAILPAIRHFVSPADRLHRRPQVFRTIGSALLRSAAFCLLSFAICAPGSAEEPSREQMQGLDEQVQEIKSDVLRIASEISILEEKLLYPSNTQVAVFVSLAEGETFRLDSAHIQIDGADVAHHIYSFEELEALRKGGVQRVYTGNVATGGHSLQFSVEGKLSSGKDFTETRSFEFRKDVEPKVVEIELAAPGLTRASIQMEDLEGGEP